MDSSRLRTALRDLCDGNKKSAEHIGIALALASEIERELRDLTPSTSRRDFKRFLDLCDGFRKALAAAGISTRDYPANLPPYDDALALMIERGHFGPPRATPVVVDDDDDDDDEPAPVRKNIIRRAIGDAR